MKAILFKILHDAQRVTAEHDHFQRKDIKVILKNEILFISVILHLIYKCSMRPCLRVVCLIRTRRIFSSHAAKFQPHLRSNFLNKFGMSKRLLKPDGTGLPLHIVWMNPSVKPCGEAAGMWLCRAEGGETDQTSYTRRRRRVALKSKATQSEWMKWAESVPDRKLANQVSAAVVDLCCCCPTPPPSAPPGRLPLAITCFLSVRLPLSVLLPARSPRVIALRLPSHPTPLGLLFNFIVCLQGRNKNWSVQQMQPTSPQKKKDKKKSWPTS